LLSGRDRKRGRDSKAPTSTHNILARAAGPPGKRIILYDYIPSRTREALKQLLVRPEGPYRGKLLTDGLEHYDDICQELQLLHFGCWQQTTVEAIEALLQWNLKPVLEQRKRQSAAPRISST
jgi:hypothetical protein